MSSNMNDKLCILVSGVGRSGTSFLTGALSKCGVYLGKRDELASHDLDPVRYNLKGTWENKKIFELQEKTYSENNIEIKNISKVERFTDPKKIVVSEKLGKEILSYFEELMNYPALAFGCKFNILLLDAWKNYLPSNLVIIGIFRHPLIVAESAKKLGWRNYPESLRYWKYGNNLILNQLKKNGGFLFNFDWPQEKLLSELRLMSKKLGLADIDFSYWYTNDLRHSDKTFQTNYKLTDDVSYLHSQLIERSSHNENVEIKKFNLTLDDLKKIVDTMIIEKLEFENYIKNNKVSTELPRKGSLAYKMLIYYDSYIAGSKRLSFSGRVLIFFLNILKPLLRKIVEEEKKP